MDFDWFDQNFTQQSFTERVCISIYRLLYKVKFIICVGRYSDNLDCGEKTADWNGPGKNFNLFWYD